MADAGTGPARLRAALLAAVVIAAIALLGRGVGGSDAQTIVLEVPPAGQAAPALLPDGTPLFITHETDGDVHVVEAINPHRFWGLTTLVGWCPPAGAFEDALDGSRFDAAGNYLYGPAPHGLATYDATRNADVVLVGERRAGAPRAVVGDPAVRQWCELGVSFNIDGFRTFDHGATKLVAHAPHTIAELLSTPGEPVQWCDGIQATDPPRCAQQLATIPGTVREDEDFSWSWQGPVRGDPAQPASLQLLAGGREEYPARGTLTRVFGRVQRLRTVADTLRLVVNRKIVFGDFFTSARPLELGEPIPRLWKMGDTDGPVLSTFTLPGGVDQDDAQAYVGELVDMVVDGNSRILSIEPVPRTRP